LPLEKKLQVRMLG